VIDLLNLFIAEVEVVTKPRDEIIQVDALDVVDATHVGLTETHNLGIILASFGHDFGINLEDTREFIRATGGSAFFAGVKYAGGDDTRSIRTSGDLSSRQDLVERFSGVADHSGQSVLLALGFDQDEHLVETSLGIRHAVPSLIHPDLIH